MNRMIPEKLLADERMKTMVDINILYAKSLLEMGIDTQTVIEANAKTWAKIGRRTGEALKPMFTDKPGLFATDQLGAMTKEMYGMVVQAESVPQGRRFRITHCPWRKRVSELPIENYHRFCRAGHRAFLQALSETIAPNLVVEMGENPSGEVTDCCVTVELFPETKVAKDWRSEV